MGYSAFSFIREKKKIILSIPLLPLAKNFLFLLFSGVCLYVLNTGVEVSFC
uniref:Uncharacterized protein n=1 Tax=Anguilla anguilla TaxID=7936 RepID=A0A0E9S057_ANGAN